MVLLESYESDAADFDGLEGEWCASVGKRTLLARRVECAKRRPDIRDSLGLLEARLGKIELRRMRFAFGRKVRLQRSLGQVLSGLIRTSVPLLKMHVKVCVHLARSSAVHTISLSDRRTHRHG